MRHYGAFVHVHPGGPPDLNPGAGNFGVTVPLSTIFLALWTLTCDDDSVTGLLPDMHATDLLALQKGLQVLCCRGVLLKIQ